ncbi:LOB domain-containing protein 41-like protein [Tanacetum coccineum]|uniref:LOB domain-containing protein 41-like protein n=1 Tax=Tanacetum coccineum TaxID=301880 RepID=A0ABQ5J9E3_9ASTR
MRMSCNGCRVLRKGCSDDCNIRPCLQWIKSPESQANATVFLAKFYGRAGLMNLVSAGPEHLRPGIFRSLLYEACGRIVNPIYGSVGLLWSGRWQMCQDAVEAVLKGSPIVQVASDAEETTHAPPLKAYDIRHVSKDEPSDGSKSNELHTIRSRCRFKKTGSKKMKGDTKRVGSEEESGRASSDHESTLSHQSETAAHVVEGDSHVMDADVSGEGPGKSEVELELTLGFEPVQRNRSCEPAGKMTRGFEDSGEGVCRMELGLDKW